MRLSYGLGLARVGSLFLVLLLILAGLSILFTYKVYDRENGEGFPVEEGGYYIYVNTSHLNNVFAANEDPQLLWATITIPGITILTPSEIVQHPDGVYLYYELDADKLYREILDHRKDIKQTTPYSSNSLPTAVITLRYYDQPRQVSLILSSTSILLAETLVEDHSLDASEWEDILSRLSTDPMAAFREPLKLDDDMIDVLYSIGSIRIIETAVEVQYSVGDTNSSIRSERIDDSIYVYYNDSSPFSDSKPPSWWRERFTTNDGEDEETLEELYWQKLVERFLGVSYYKVKKQSADYSVADAVSDVYANIFTLSQSKKITASIIPLKTFVEPDGRWNDTYAPRELDGYPAYLYLPLFQYSARVDGVASSIDNLITYTHVEITSNALITGTLWSGTYLSATETITTRVSDARVTDDMENVEYYFLIPVKPFAGAFNGESYYDCIVVDWKLLDVITDQDGYTWYLLKPETTIITLYSLEPLSTRADGWGHIPVVLRTTWEHESYYLRVENISTIAVEKILSTQNFSSGTGDITLYTLSIPNEDYARTAPLQAPALKIALSAVQPVSDEDHRETALTSAKDKLRIGISSLDTGNSAVHVYLELKAMGPPDGFSCHIEVLNYILYPENHHPSEPPSPVWAVGITVNTASEDANP